jgi:FkbM family methyltransferase
MTVRPRSIGERWRTWRGIIRSLRIYYSGHARQAAMDALYREFVRPGDLVFDVGAHVGNRTAAFRRLGARVVAIEPQPALVRTLKLIHGRDHDVVIEATAIGRRSGTIELKLNLDNPTVATASETFIAAAGGAPGWEGQAWTGSVQVPLTTLDSLIARHGQPAFMKIDVEGFEVEALHGLSVPPPALSFEFTTIQRDVAAAALRRCGELGYVRFNAALGESQQFAHREWIGAEAMARWIAELPHAANSGDVYARLA